MTTVFRVLSVSPQHHHIRFDQGAHGCPQHVSRISALETTMLKKLKKVLLSSSVIVLFALYAVQEQTHPPGALPIVSQYMSTVTVVPSATSPGEASTVSAYATTLSPAPSVTSQNAPPSVASSVGKAQRARASGAYRDGSYTGASADAYWGTVEVQAVIADGHISDVQFLQYPNHRSRSQSINQQAMPMLTQEAIQSQRAEVDVVTGATDTSDAFIQSLASALQQAAS